MSKESLRQKMVDNPFPNEQVDPKIKRSKEFGMKVARAILYRHNFYSSATNKVAKIQENRYYASGRQDVNKYKPRLDPYMDSQNALSHVNIDWSIEPVCPKVINQLIGGMINQDHRIQVNSIDPQSKINKEKQRDKYYANIIREEQLTELEQQAGAQLFPKEENAPKTSEEIDMYMSMDYREPIEISFEEIIDYEMYRNDFNMIKNQVIRDIVENNLGVVRRYWDENNDIRLRWVDIQNYITSYTEDPKHSDVEYQGELHEVTIRELRRLSDGTLSEEELFQIAQDAANRNENYNWIYGNQYNNAGEYNGQEYSYDDYRIQVLDFVYYTTDLKVYEKKKKKNGGYYMNKKDVNYTPPERSNRKKERIDKEYQMSYGGMWAVDANKMVYYGKSKNIVRPEDPTGIKSIDPRMIKDFIVIEPNIRGGQSTSLVDIMKPTLDEMQLLVLKMRHILAEVAPPGASIDVSALNNLQLGTDGVTPTEVISMWKNKGILIYDGEDDSGNPMNRKPIEEMLNGVQGALVPLVNQWMFKLETLRTTTGINDAADGSSPDKDALVGIQKLRIISANNATREIYQAYLEGILQPVGSALVPMIKTKIQYLDGVQEYQNVISREGVRAIEFTPKAVSLCRLGIKVEALPNAEDIQILDANIQRSLDSQEIRLEDAIEVRRIMNPKKAERYLIYRRKKYQEEKMKEFQQKEQMTSQREQQAAMAAAEAEKVKEAARAEREIAVKEAELRFKMELDDHQTKNKIQIVDREGYWKERHIEEAETAEDTGIDANQDGGTPKGGGGPSISVGGGAGIPRPISKPRVFSHPDKAAKRV